MRIYKSVSAQLKNHALKDAWESGDMRVATSRSEWVTPGKEPKQPDG
jgi:hypothetical protein